MNNVINLTRPKELIDAHPRVETSTDLESSLKSLMHWHDKQQDYITAERNLAWDWETAPGRNIPLVNHKGFEYTLSDRALQQSAARLNIPIQYARRMVELEPELFSTSFQQWGSRSDKNVMIRSYDGAEKLCRAILSDKYKILNNQTVMSTVIETALDTEKNRYGLEFDRIRSTEDHFRMFFTSPDTRVEVVKNDPVQFGFMVSNSEVGQGSLELSVFAKRLVCLNGMTIMDRDAVFRRRHIGRALGETGHNSIQMSADTLHHERALVKSIIRDGIKGIMSGDLFETIVAKYRAAAVSKLVVDPFKSVEKLQKVVTLSDDESRSVITKFISDGDMSQWGMANALTFQAHTSSPGRAYELEQAGAQVINMTTPVWDAITEAA